MKDFHPRYLETIGTLRNAGVTQGEVARILGVTHGAVRSYIQRHLPRLGSNDRLSSYTRTWPPRTEEERFWSFVNKTDSCWMWTGANNGKGYGHFYVRSRGRQGYAHRWSYEAFKGSIPNGLHIDHLCRNHSCVNPDHLEAVTPHENMLRGKGVGPQLKRRKTHCLRGHVYADNTRIIAKTKKRGEERVCVLCDRIRKAKYQQRLRALKRSETP